MADELWKKSATELAGLIRSKQVSSREVIESHLARIDAVNTKVNAITVVLRESALEAADAADKQDASGPLHGVPFTINRLRFVTPANVLGLPAAEVPTGVTDGLTTGVQVYADRWREDLCLAGAEIIEAALGQICPIDPVF